MSQIPGTLDWRQLSDLHRPQDPQAIAAEIRRQYAAGLRPRDISMLMRLPMTEVLAAIAEVAADGGT